MSLFAIFMPLFLGGLSYNPIPIKTAVMSNSALPDASLCQLSVLECPNELKVEFTAYNSLASQTDQSPCISASGKNICGRDDVIACPRKYKLGSQFLINGKIYVCEDRTSFKIDGWDMFMDKDLEGAVNFGRRDLWLTIEN